MNTEKEVVDQIMYKTVKSMAARLLCCTLSCAVAVFCAPVQPSAASVCAHDTSRNVQTQGVGNPFGYGERNTPENASTAEIRAINHKMSVQEVKYSLYKEIDEHWELISLRLGQTEREKVYALFAGIATRESTIGGNGNGGDLETAYQEGFGVSSAHAYGPLQTAVTGFTGCDPDFMQETDVPEMKHYAFTESNFYDCIISNHTGIRKIIHFARSAMVDYDLHGYAVMRGALKGFNTGWANDSGDPNYYRSYPDEICALAQWYYTNGHLYDNEFTWTDDSRAAQFRGSDVWSWWGNTEPSLAEVGTEILGDVDLNGRLEAADYALLGKYSLGKASLSSEQTAKGDMNASDKTEADDMLLLKRALLVK